MPELGSNLRYEYVVSSDNVGIRLLSLTPSMQGELKCGHCLRIIGTWHWHPHPKHTLYGQLEPPLIRVHKNVVQEVDVPLDVTPANTPRLLEGDPQYEDSASAGSLGCAQHEDFASHRHSQFDTFYCILKRLTLRFIFMYSDMKQSISIIHCYINFLHLVDHNIHFIVTHNSYCVILYFHIFSIKTLNVAIIIPHQQLTIKDTRRWHVKLCMRVLLLHTVHIAVRIYVSVSARTFVVALLMIITLFSIKCIM